ncbi:gamma-glutamyltransferase family protein [Serratia sp. DD3]|uniref:gamma-glutamyltransferase family protein n=1 Tax=Serratia sp. DD3 TaxID=1410619 RepID=UPI0003C4E9B8|nr:gamma-glutamyltransferase family protein [Serratia sp. DD3]KEY58410.1 putative gamma-glutamyltransferase YwrD [Serratia sp. DD3]
MMKIKAYLQKKCWVLARRFLVSAVVMVSLQGAFAQTPAASNVQGQVPKQDQQPANMGLRPAIMGPTAAVSTGDPLVTAVATRILLQGGNAFDAGVAALIAGGVLEQDLYSLGGEALVLVYPVADAKVTSIVGQGWAPKAVDVDWYISRDKTLQGEGLDPAVVPGALHAALTVLERWGTMSFEQVSAPAIDYAEKGFPMRISTARAIAAQSKLFERWPGNKTYWYKADGTPYKVGETITLPATAKTLRRMVEAERTAKAQGREAGIVAARDRFYKGDIAKEMVAFLRQNDAPFDESDFAEFYARIEEPTSTTYRGYTIYKQGFGSQGPVLLQTLNILEQFDLKAMGYGSADYLHTIVEALKLAYADRDTYYADPAFVNVPAEGLLSKAYAKERAALINPKHASTQYVAGNPLKFDSRVKEWPYAVINVQDVNRKGQSAALLSEPIMLASLGRDSAGISKDTTHMAIVDKDGNLFDATPSGAWIPGAVILGDTGIAMSVRGEQFWLDKQHANQVRPHARPRYTLTPSLIFKDGKPFMALGSPGGDNQEQTILQAMLSTIDRWEDWYPNLNKAFEMPRVQTSHLYGSFWPHAAGFNKLAVEATVPDEVYNELKARGHDVSRLRTFGMSGCATSVLIDPNSGNRFAGADPRRDCYSIAY